MTYITAALKRALIRSGRHVDLMHPDELVVQRLLRELLEEGIYLKEMSHVKGKSRRPTPEQKR